jgi:predicted ribosomally synthesized peptide with SipW-like signal peptide
MSRKRLKQYLMLLLAIGVVAIAVSGSGTFASFSAQVTNPGNAFVSGTLFLHDTNGATTCTSESATASPNFNVNPGDGTNGDSCAVLFNNVDFSAGAATADLALDNAGTIAASDIVFSVGNCTWSDNSASTGSAVLFGSVPTCGDMYVTVQETDSSYGVNAFCAYGPTPLAVACAAPDNTATFANAATPTQLQMNNGSGSATTATLAAGATRYYVITIDPGGVTSGNQLQNRAVSFDLTWKIDS